MNDSSPNSPDPGTTSGTTPGTTPGSVAVSTPAATSAPPSSNRESEIENRRSAPTPRHLSRRRFLRGLVYGGLGVTLAGASYSRWVEPFWPDFHELPMPIPRLPPALEGLRICHLTDIHVSEMVSSDYLRRVFARVNDLKPDVVVLTGDLVMYYNPWVEQAVQIIRGLKPAPIVTFGNHDYGVYRPGKGQRSLVTADSLESELAAIGCTVLRNVALPLERGGGRVWLVGLEEIWSGHFSPEQAFGNVPPGEPTIALSHNPDTVPLLTDFAPDWILCGHTHGGQVRIPFYGAITLPVEHREWDQGLFQVGPSKLYVSRAVGYLRQIRFCCRPEVPTFRLTAA